LKHLSGVICGLIVANGKDLIRDCAARNYLVTLKQLIAPKTVICNKWSVYADPQA